jgi:hypothetical protein
MFVSLINFDMMCTYDTNHTHKFYYVVVRNCYSMSLYNLRRFCKENEQLFSQDVIKASLNIQSIDLHNFFLTLPQTFCMSII